MTMGMQNTSEAWIAVDAGFATIGRFARFQLTLTGDRSLYQAVAADHWVLVVNGNGGITRVGRVLRIRSDLTTTTLYFDRLLQLREPISLGLTTLSPPASGSVGRIQWSDFLATLDSVLYTPIGQVPLIGANSDPHELAYIRELLQLAVTDDLLGPAGGPHEHIVDS